MLKKYFSEIWLNRYILYSLVQRDLQTKYRNSKIGIAWSVIMPLGMAFIVGVVYGILFSYPPEKMIPMIFSGINPWNFMVSSADAGAMVFLGAEGYIKQTTVPTQIYPLRATLSNFVTLLYSELAFFFIYLFIAPDQFGPAMLLVIPGLLIMFFFALGLANISSICNLYVRDFAPLQSLLFQALFYATPIFYDPQMLDDRGYSIIYKINPFYYILEVVRKPMLGNVPSINFYLITCGITVLVFYIGVYLQIKNEKKIVYLL